MSKQSIPNVKGKGNHKKGPLPVKPKKGAMGGGNMDIYKPKMKKGA
jgi:hypothetical protein